MKESRIIHVYESHHETNVTTLARQSKAHGTWRTLYAQGVVDCAYSHYVRVSNSVGDPRGLPFLKDCIAHGLSKCESESDICMWTNSDSLLHPSLPSALRMFCAIYEVCTAQRREFKNGYPDGQYSIDQIVGMSGPHLGRDLFAATKRWFIKHWDQIPDFLLAASEFDLCLAAMVRTQKLHQTTHQNLFERVQCCEIPQGYISHESHDPEWNRVGRNNAANSYNHHLFKKWAEKYSPSTPVPI